jgi:hypothetical protein
MANSIASAQQYSGRFHRARITLETTPQVRRPVVPPIESRAH